MEDTGEVNRLVQVFKGETPIPIISQSVIELFTSRGHQRRACLVIGAMDKGFGGHLYGEVEETREERITGRVDNEPRRDLSREEESLESVRSDENAE